MTPAASVAARASGPAAGPGAKAIEWHDLVALTGFEVVTELTLSLPWLLASLGGFWAIQATGSWWWLLPAQLSAFYLFLTGLRQTHGACHRSIGLSRRGCDLLMAFLSIIMTGSMHAVRVNHLQHHRHELGDDDVEGFPARLSWWRAIALGPIFPLRLHAVALRTASSDQLRWVRAELAGNALWHGLVAWLVLAQGEWWLALFILTTWGGQCGTAFFAVWTVHRGCDGTHRVARTQRGRFRNALSYQMFRHLEHHLFPAVPTCHWPELSRRLDATAPDGERLMVH